MSNSISKDISVHKGGRRRSQKIDSAVIMSATLVSFIEGFITWFLIFISVGVLFYHDPETPLLSLRFAAAVLAYPFFLIYHAFRLFFINTPYDFAFLEPNMQFRAPSGMFGYLFKEDENRNFIPQLRGCYRLVFGLGVGKKMMGNLYENIQASVKKGVFDGIMTQLVRGPEDPVPSSTLVDGVQLAALDFGKGQQNMQIALEAAQAGQGLLSKLSTAVGVKKPLTLPTMSVPDVSDKLTRTTPAPSGPIAVVSNFVAPSAYPTNPPPPVNMTLPTPKYVYIPPVQTGGGSRHLSRTKRHHTRQENGVWCRMCEAFGPSQDHEGHAHVLQSQII